MCLTSSAETYSFTEHILPDLCGFSELCIDEERLLIHRDISHWCLIGYFEPVCLGKAAG